MTRAGARQRPWTTGERALLAELAGAAPKREVCRRLRRSSASVAGMAARLRAEGVPVDLRCHVSRLETCPACGSLSATCGRHGICEPCRVRRQIEAVQSRIADLLPLLDPEERARYADAEAETASRADPMPRAPDVAGLSRYAAALERDRHERAVERWSVRNLRRRLKAAQKRKERIEKKARTSSF